MDAPPSRYRVVERGRRLIVIDRQAENAGGAGSPAGTSSRPAEARGFRRTRYDGGGVLVTRRWYDDHGPRTLTLGAGTAAMLGRVRLVGVVAAMLLVVAAIWQPMLVAMLLLGGLPLLNEEARTPLRRRATAWLDRIAAQ